jgi:hypothetical protein
MSDRVSAILQAMRRAFATGKAPANQPVATTIGQLISALDDRNIIGAIRLLQPTDADRRKESRCERCIGRGE